MSLLLDYAYREHRMAEGAMQLPPTCVLLAAAVATSGRARCFGQAQSLHGTLALASCYEPA
jgi:hypothetical protein